MGPQAGEGASAASHRGRAVAGGFLWTGGGEEVRAEGRQCWGLWENVHIPVNLRNALPLQGGSCTHSLWSGESPVLSSGLHASLHSWKLGQGPAAPGISASVPGTAREEEETATVFLDGEGSSERMRACSRNLGQEWTGACSTAPPPGTRAALQRPQPWTLLGAAFPQRGLGCPWEPVF